MPFDAMRKRRPDWVPDETFTLVLPLSMVGTSNSPPSGAVALKEQMRGQRQKNVEIARRPAANAGLAFARKPNARAVFHALRDIDRQGPFPRHTPGTRA